MPYNFFFFFYEDCDAIFFLTRCPCDRQLAPHKHERWSDNFCRQAHVHEQGPADLQGTINLYSDFLKLLGAVIVSPVYRRLFGGRTHFKELHH